MTAKLIFGIIAIVIGALLLGFGIVVVLDSQVDETITIGHTEYVVFDFLLDTDDEVRVEFSVVGGMRTVDFHILDDVNYRHWVNDESYDSEVSVIDEDTDTLAFTAPEDGTYWFVFYNPESLPIELKVELTYHDMQAGGVVCSITAVIFLILGIALVVAGRRQPGPTWPPSSFPPPPPQESWPWPPPEGWAGPPVEGYPYPPPQGYPGAPPEVWAEPPPVAPADWPPAAPYGPSAHDQSGPAGAYRCPQCGYAVSQYDPACRRCGFRMR